MRVCAFADAGSSVHVRAAAYLHTATRPDPVCAARCERCAPDHDDARPATTTAASPARIDLLRFCHRIYKIRLARQIGHVRTTHWRAAIQRRPGLQVRIGQSIQFGEGLLQLSDRVFQIAAQSNEGDVRHHTIGSSAEASGSPAADVADFLRVLRRRRFFSPDPSGSSISACLAFPAS